MIAAKGTDTVVTGKKLGHPVRALKTPFTTKFAKMEGDPEVTPEQIMEFGTGSLRKAVKDGDLAMGSYMAGQSVGLVNARESAAEIIDDIVNGAAEVFRKRGVEFFE